MRSIIVAAVLVVGITGIGLAEDPASRGGDGVEPSIADPPSSTDPDTGTNPTGAKKRFEQETQPKSDEMLANAVAANLSADPRVNAMNVHVAAREGVVTLTGSADKVAEKDAAEQVAYRVPGVRRVENEIAVKDHGALTPGTPPIPEQVR